MFLLGFGLASPMNFLTRFKSRSAAIVGSVLLMLGAELVLRYLGFADPLLYVPDDKIGHLLAKSQTATNFGNHVEINQYSMRGPEVSKTPSAGEFRVLMLGDSVLNGVWWTDQSQTISARLQAALETDIRSHIRASLSQATPTTQWRSAQVLNASAQSWSPRNEVEYLKRFGSFDSHLLVLVINTEDLFSTKPNAQAVGVDPNHPAHKPLLAIAAAENRYLHLLPKPPTPSSPESTEEPLDRLEKCLEAMTQIYQITRDRGIPLIVALTPLKRELLEPSREEERVALDRLNQWATANPITLIDFLPIFKAIPHSAQLYRDGIHLSPLGNQEVSDRIMKQIQNYR
jgi:GDSL-like Lipase/Acylhydrolase family